MMSLTIAVALRLECVDRNTVDNLENLQLVVALRLECVDRNWEEYPRKVGKAVALRLECVDRNRCLQLEIMKNLVALRLECVDRNQNTNRYDYMGTRSHSVWSAWIEITLLHSNHNQQQCRTPFGVRG